MPIEFRANLRGEDPDTGERIRIDDVPVRVTVSLPATNAWTPGEPLQVNLAMNGQVYADDLNPQPQS